MEYMLMFFETEGELARREQPERDPEYLGAWSAYAGAIVASGIVKSGAGLQAPRTAARVRVQGGQRQVQDGPFATTREHLGGYFVIDVPSLEAALEWAARAPNASTGYSEVRALLPRLPAA